MLVRLVRMTFLPDRLDHFLIQFDEAAPQIRSVPGCRHLELWRDADDPTVCTTYSHWDDRAALDRYRESDLFRSTWDAVTPLFDARPVAHSYRVAREGDIIEAAADDA